MIVIGGTYSEYCYHPEWDQIFGSGGRRAAALSSLGVKKVSLTTCAPPNEIRAVRATLAPYNVNPKITESHALYEFIYTHPLSEPYLKPFPADPTNFKKPVRADAVLVYGMLEGLPRVSAKRIVFDPQSETEPAKPFDFIDAVEKLAVVLNQTEVANFSKTNNVIEGAKRLIKKNGVEVVVVKQGPFGCLVIDAKSVTAVPVYPSKYVFKIGSGDVFSAVFAKFWALDGRPAVESAHIASRCTSIYCNSRSVDTIKDFENPTLRPLEKKRTPSVYLAGPFFRWDSDFSWKRQDARCCL
jgi:pfkB family carbohydrate kinase